jgi:hypothetical protein
MQTSDAIITVRLCEAATRKPRNTAKPRKPGAAQAIAPRKSPISAASAGDHDRVREAHRRLCQIGGGERPGNGDGRADFRSDGRMSRQPRKNSPYHLVGPRREQAGARATISNCIRFCMSLHLQQICSKTTRMS